MSQTTFKALVVSESPGNQFTRRIASRSFSELPPGDVLIRVLFSSLNYKDGLSATGNRGVTKNYPHTPGVDAAGIVEESTSPDFAVGEEVIVTGYDLGSHTDGGWAEYIRVPAPWVVRKPKSLSLRQTMIYGTAGLTAGISLYKLVKHGLSTDQGPVVVTGATGGVGSLAVALFAKEGFHVIAVTGKMEEQQFLLDLGAREVKRRDEILDASDKPLLSGRWAGAVDTVGGPLLDSVIRQTKLEGAVAACGNVVSADLRTSVYPFILRGVALIGINSAFTPMVLRLEIWSRLATEWRLPNFEERVTEVSLDQINSEYIDLILKGRVRGRVVVNIGL